MKGKNQQERFRCPMCGMVADLERIEQADPYELERFLQHYGGKVKATADQRQAQRGKEIYRGSGSGSMRYETLPVTSKIRNLVARRVEQLSNLFVAK
ncbi:MAG: hypothetical protein ACYDHZ_00600 [Dehalococcoidia bacterium]